MDWNGTSPMGVLKQRLQWLTHRQQVLAHNIANADTPQFVPHDLKPFQPTMTAPGPAPVGMITTDPAHLAGRPVAVRSGEEVESRDVFEATPIGNAVVLEEQLAKLNETAGQHSLASGLYRKYMGLVRTAAAVRG